VALADPLLDAFRVIEMSLVANQWGHFLVFREIDPAYGTFCRQIFDPMQVVSEFDPIEGAYNFWNGKRYLNEASNESIFIEAMLP